VVPQSIMPAYGFLKRTELRTTGLPNDLAALKRLGVPYTDAMVRNATDDAKGQADPDSAWADGVRARYGEATNVRTFDGDAGAVTEMDALVAYLQILGQLTDVTHASEPGARK